MNFKRLLLVLITVSSFLYAKEEVKSSSWSYDIQLYMLAVWIEGDSQMGRIPQKFNVDVTPDDIFSNLKTGGMAHIEAHQKTGFGVWFDYAFMNLGMGSNSQSGLISNQLGVYQGILEAFATYRVPSKYGNIDYLGGVRWWHNKFDYTMTANSMYSTSKTIDWYDPVIGIRWIYPFNENWSFKARGDIGGFGIESDFTSVIELGVMYDITENWQVDVRLKSLWVDYETGQERTRDRFTYKTVNYGPIVGITYRF
jgi:hypothetical protein